MQQVFFEINEEGSEVATSTGRTNDVTGSQKEGMGKMSMRMLALCGSLTSFSPPAVQYTIGRAKWLFKLFMHPCGWSLRQKKKKKREREREREGTDIY